MSVLLVTGASRGIGAAIARAGASQGYSIALNYRRSRDQAEALAAEITANGGMAVALQADVSIESDVVRLFEQVGDQLGPLTALVNNAGILEQQCRVEEMSTARFQRIFAINSIGPMICSREAVKLMSTANGGPGGGIVNISSMAAVLGSPNEYVDYAASKGAIDTLTVGLAKEVASCGIRVNGVRPGVIYTDIHASGGEPDRVDRVKGNVPMQRGGTADEVAQAVLWLLSDSSRYCTGTFIDVSGGR